MRIQERMAWFPTVTILALAMGAGCATVKVEPVQVEVKPIHVTVDVNVKVQKVDQALDDFFGDVYGTAPATNAAAASTNTPASAK